MKRASSRILLGSLSLGLIWACGEATSGEMLGGETHWLRSCSGSGRNVAECGPNLECLCGVCTSACDAAASCAELGSGAQCSASNATEYASACATETPPRLCVRGQNVEPGGTPGVSIEGARYDANGNCFGTLELAGRIAMNGDDLGCDDAETFALGPDGACWRFPNACVPDGFTPLGLFSEFEPCIGTDVRCVGALSCEAEQVATVDGCLGCNEARVQMVDALREHIGGLGLNTCNSDLDCVAEGWETGCGGHCPMAVNASSVASFQAELPPFSAIYCSDPNAWRETCGLVDVDCDITAICRAGRCVIGGGLPCSERALENCENDGDCERARAFPFDAAGQCFTNDGIDVACVVADVSCPPVTALDGDGNCFLFGNCLPAGFTRAPEGHVCTAALGSQCG